MVKMKMVKIPDEIYNKWKKSDSREIFWEWFMYYNVKWFIVFSLVSFALGLLVGIMIPY